MTTPKVTPISIVMTTHDQAPELQRNLPQLLSLHYEAGFEVIVVDESSTDGTDDVLKQLKREYSNLYTTYIPATSHYLSRRKLALMLGIKAAKNEWIILTEPDCHPDSDRWLEAMGEAMTDDVDTLCGYTAYEPGTKAEYVYLRMYTWWRQQRCPYRYDGANLAIRKSAFMERNGFLQNLRYRRGEYDFIVNETDRSRIATVRSDDSRMRQKEPTEKTWRNAQMHYMETRRHLKRTLMHRLVFASMQLLRHLSCGLLLAALVYAVIRHNALYAVLAAVAILLLIGQSAFFCYRLAKAYGEKIPLWKMPLLDLWVGWHYVHYGMKYMLADKSDFIRK